MKKLLTLLAILFLVSCSKDNDEILQEEQNLEVIEEESQNYEKSTHECLLSGSFSNTNVTFYEATSIFEESYWEFSWDFEPFTALRSSCDYKYTIELDGKSGTPPFCVVPSPNMIDGPTSTSIDSFRVYESELSAPTCFRFRIILEGEDCILNGNTYDCISYSPWNLYQP